MGALTTQRSVTRIRLERSASAPEIADRSWRTILGVYVALTKPRIIGLLLITTIPAMVLAEQGWPSWWLVVATVVGGTLAAGGANAINCVVDRDIDAVMQRTKSRPLPAGLVGPVPALLFALMLEAAAFALLLATSNLLAASLALAATAFYVFIYTLWLKRSTPQNIVIGGAAGAFPPLVGWAAVTGEVAPAAMVLFAIIFVWTPPHFWSLSIKYRDDYERAGVPMMPVVASMQSTTRQILIYSVALVPVSLLLLATSEVSWIYGGSALLLGGAFVSQTWRLHMHASPTTAMAAFKTSIYYLGILFIAALADVLILS